MMDIYGLCGFAFHYACLFALFGSAFLAFCYFWKKKRLDFEQEISLQPFLIPEDDDRL